MQVFPLLQTGRALVYQIDQPPYGVVNPHLGSIISRVEGDAPHY